MDTTKFIKGIHHVTATVNDAQEDFDFYTRLLSLRLVKKTVNFDNHQVYHFYYGNEAGEPGTIMTTFPYKDQGVRWGEKGSGQVAITTFSIPSGSLDFWTKRLEEAGVTAAQKTVFGYEGLYFEDPSGLALALIGSDEDSRRPWAGGSVGAEHAIRGFFSATLSIAEPAATFEFLNEVMGFEKIGSEGSLSRWAVNGGGAGNFLDIREDPETPRGKNGLGTVHHIAWQIENDPNQLALRTRLLELGFRVTDIKDRKYFHSIYFRIPGGVLFEVATIPPGFQVDESLEELGRELKLPAWEEPKRAEIERILPTINE
ncbi:MAG: ring-cleaving dioxygenase [Bacteroidota bacterium]